MWRDGARPAAALHRGSGVGRDGWCWFGQGKKNCASSADKRKKNDAEEIIMNKKCLWQVKI